MYGLINSVLPQLYSYLDAVLSMELYMPLHPLCLLYGSLVPRRLSLEGNYVWHIVCIEVVQTHCSVRPNQIAEQRHVIFATTTNLI